MFQSFCKELCSSERLSVRFGLYTDHSSSSAVIYYCFFYVYRIRFCIVEKCIDVKGKYIVEAVHVPLNQRTANQHLVSTLKPISWGQFGSRWAHWLVRGKSVGNRSPVGAAWLCVNNSNIHKTFANIFLKGNRVNQICRCKTAHHSSYSQWSTWESETKPKERCCKRSTHHSPS